MKKLLALLLVCVLALGFTACGGGGEEEAAPAAKTLEEKYGINYTAAGEQVMSSERASKDVLIETRDVWLEGKMSFVLDENPKTYEDFVEHIGCDASVYSYSAEDAERSFTWIAEGDETAKFMAVFWETPQGWVLYTMGSTNLA